MADGHIQLRNEPSPFDAVRINIEDLFTQAKGFLDVLRHKCGKLAACADLRARRNFGLGLCVVHGAVPSMFIS